MRFEHDGRYCYSYVDDAMLAQTGADGEDTEDMVNTLLGQDGVDVAALFKAIEGEIRVSLRSNGARQRGRLRRQRLRRRRTFSRIGA